MSQNAQNVVKQIVVSLFFSGGGGIHHPPSNVGLNKMELLQSQAPAERELLGNSADRTLVIGV